MDISYTGRKRFRKSFGRIPEVAPMPNLIELQKVLMIHFYNMTFKHRTEKMSVSKLHLSLFSL